MCLGLKEKVKHGLVISAKNWKLIFQALSTTLCLLSN